MAKASRLALVNKDPNPDNTASTIAMTEPTISRQLALLGIPRSSYYYRLKPTPETELNLSLMRKIDELHLKYPFYGVLKMRAELTTPEQPINEKRVRRLMRTMGIQMLYRRPNLSKPCPWSIKYPYLLRGLDICRSNQVWSIDITYIPMAKGFMYLCAVIDWQSRYLLGWKLSNTLTADFCVEMLSQAVATYGKPEIINTDQGSQFTSDLFTGWVDEAGITLSMDGKGRATDNVMIERFWRSLKYENIYLYGYESVSALSAGIKSYVHFYNEERKHQSLGYITPGKQYRTKAEPKPVVVCSRFNPINFLYGLPSFTGGHLKIYRDKTDPINQHLTSPKIITA